MHQLIEEAKRAVDQAELYWQQDRTTSVRYENYRLQQITENDLSSVAVRAIDGGKLGSTFGVTPDQAGLVDEAKQAAAYGDPAGFSFAPSARYPDVTTHDPATGRLTSDELVELCESIKERAKRLRPDIALFISATTNTNRLVVETTEGACAETESSAAVVGFGAPIKGAGIPVFKSLGSISPVDVPDELIGEFDEWYAWTEKTSTPSTGRLPVIFAPEGAFLYLLPLWAGVDGDAVEKKTSPLVGRTGEQIFSERLTIIDDPLRPGDVGSRPFDDEGVPCARRAIVENGVLKDYLLDLRTGAALGRASTGNALKRALFGGGTETPPAPWPMNVSVEPGNASLKDMIADLDEGLLVAYGMGFHSGNYPQGQFAVQAIGYHIVGGKVIGRLDRTMISANIYEDFLRIRAISAEQRRSYNMLGANAPYVLVDSIQVAGA